MDTDALLVPARTARTRVKAWKSVVDANTAAFKEVRVDLDTCNNVDKVRAVIAKVEKAMEDLSTTSQKVETATSKEEKDDEEVKPPYGQYPVSDPLHPHNPVPRPPGYVPPPDTSPVIVTLMYNYQNNGGQPPNGFCYQVKSSPAFVSISNTDLDSGDNIAFLTSIAAGDTISTNGVTWTVTEVQVKGSNVMFTVDPAVIAPPEGITGITFNQLVSKASKKEAGGKK